MPNFNMFFILSSILLLLPVEISECQESESCRLTKFYKKVSVITDSSVKWLTRAEPSPNYHECLVKCCKEDDCVGFTLRKLTDSPDFECRMFHCPKGQCHLTKVSDKAAGVVTIEKLYANGKIVKLDELEVEEQASPGTTGPGEQASSGTAGPGEQASPGTAGPGEQASPGTTGPGEQASTGTPGPGEQASPGTSGPGEQASPRTPGPGEQASSGEPRETLPTRESTEFTTARNEFSTEIPVLVTKVGHQTTVEPLTTIFFEETTKLIEQTDFFSATGNSKISTRGFSRKFASETTEPSEVRTEPRTFVEKLRPDIQRLKDLENMGPTPTMNIDSDKLTTATFWTSDLPKTEAHLNLGA